MEEMKIDNHLVIYDNYKIENKPELQAFLKSEEIIKILEKLKDDVIMVLGGDGTILEAVRKYYKQDKSFLPINYGSKGFLLNDKNFIDKDSEFEQREYPLMDVEIITGNQAIKDVAFNEFVIKDVDLQMVNLNISIDDKQKLDIKGDGLLISTPAGSTAYNSSLKGPILPHSSKHFTMPYMAAWEPKLQAPTILGDDSIVKIQNQGRIHSMVIGVDSKMILRTVVNQEVEITIQKSRHTIKLLIEKSYKKFWDSKVLEEQGFSH